MDIRQKTCLIIRKNGEYLVGINHVMHCLNWSVSPYDAWRTRRIDTAKAVARVTGGMMCLFNPIVGQLKEV